MTKNIGDKILSEIACTMCSLGIFNPKEVYNNSKEETITTSLLNDDCTSCSIYEQLLKNNTKDNYTQNKK